MPATVHPSALGLFSTLATSRNLSSAARELGLTAAAVSKHLAQMEARAGVTLVNRTTRRMNLTPEGELYLSRARRILDDIDDLAQSPGSSPESPKGWLRVNATLGFGRGHVAPAISRFVAQYPQMSVQLQLSVTPPPLTKDAFDVCIRFGEPPDARVVARRLAPNRRILCAAPSYFAAHGMPGSPRDLTRHNCIGIRQGDEAYGVWRLTRGRGDSGAKESVKIRGNLATNDGEVAVKWALDGHGILMRAEWDIRQYLDRGELIQILSAYQTPNADIFAVYPRRQQLSQRIRAFVDFLAASLKRPA